MNEDPNSETPPTNDPSKTGDKETPPATSTDNGNGGKPTNDDSKNTPSPNDVKNLQRQRDKANNSLGEAQERIGELESVVGDMQRDKAINAFLKDNATEYPDVTAEDLANVISQEDMVDTAKRLQRRFEDVVQKKLHDIENPAPPRMTEDEMAAAEAKAMKDGSPKALSELYAKRAMNL